MNVSNIEFSIPRKLDGSTYSCQLFQGTKKSNICILFNKVKIISSESTSLLFKSTKDDMHNLMFDLNTHIVETVKKNYHNWFVSNMNPEYIEEYYSNTLIYNKEHGDLIKLKCISGTELIKNYNKNKKYDIEIIFKNLRFYKQKFVLECTIKSCEESNNNYDLIDIDNSDIDNSDNEEMPEPEPEEVLLIKKTYLKNIKTYIKNIKNNIKDLEDKKNILFNLMAKLEISEHYSEIVSLCEQFENKCE
jgi:hypothetical protein